LQAHINLTIKALRKLLIGLLLFTGSISVNAQEDKVYTSLEEALANKDKA